MSKILLITDEMSQGGAERQLSYLAIGLKNLAHDVRLIKFYDGVNAFYSDLEDNGIKTEIYNNGKNIVKRPFVIANIIRNWKPDMVVAYKDGACMAACIARMMVPFNLVVSERNTTQKLTIKERVKFQLYRMANHVIPNSFSQKEFILKNISWLASKVTVITNMIDTKRFCMMEKKYNTATEVPHIVTVGRITPQKNVLTYLEAIAKIKDQGISCHFDWWGRIGSTEYFEEVKKKLSRLKLEDTITFHGGTDEIDKVYGHTSYFCLPSIYEGFPNVLCEAMASGLVCIASNVCDNPYILTAKERLFDPYDAESIARSIKNVLSLSLNDCKKESAHNSSLIHELCAPNVFVKKYESLINQNL